MLQMENSNNNQKKVTRKNYYYTIFKSTPRRYYGGCNESAKVFGVKHGKIILLGTVSWCTAGYKGARHEVYTLLNELKLVTNKEFKRNEGYYYSRDSKVNIQEL